VQTTLKDAGRGTTSGRGQRRLRSALVVAEVALAVVLTLGAGLLLRSFLSVLAVDPGFTPARLLTLQIALPPAYQTADQRRALYADLFARLEAIPGRHERRRHDEAAARQHERHDESGRRRARAPAGEWPEVEFRRALRTYFTAMGIPAAARPDVQRSGTAPAHHPSS
jgi:hypothetical protein